MLMERGSRPEDLCQPLLVLALALPFMVIRRLLLLCRSLLCLLRRPRLHVERAYSQDLHAHGTGVAGERR